MINLEAYPASSIVFLKNVAASKKKKKGESAPFYKDRIEELIPALQQPYADLDSAYMNKNLVSLKSTLTFTEQEKKDLLLLYKYSSKPFIELKNKLTELPNNRSIDTCQYCTINSINTLDHITPKEKFPEYVIHPKNLFPACSQCNSAKSTKWLKNGVPEFLNLYLDELPLKQYLFVKIEFKKNTFEVNFFLNNKNGIDSKLFETISRHFYNLDLLDRFKKKSNEVISEFENTILGSLSKLSLSDALECAINSITLESNRIGINHYKNVLELELSEGNDFKDYCILKGFK